MPNKPKTRNITIRLADDIRQALETESAQTGETISNLIRQTLDQRYRIENKTADVK